MTNFKKLVGDSSELQSVIRASQIVAATDVSVLILGESGTGKELLARAIHQESRRADRPMVTINCAALPDSLAESELFGYRKGSFTGAVGDQDGKLLSADGGTLFLDEVGELSLAIQAKVLRFLETGECQILGASNPVNSDVRIIAATHRDLQAQVRAGTFREDLFYRLYVVPLELPSLRDRSSDITMLLENFTGILAREHDLPLPTYSKEAVSLLQHYNWPGNVRELRNFCERMVILLSGKTIDVGNLPHEIRTSADSSTRKFGTISLTESGINLGELESELITQALHKTDGNRTHAARLLGLTRDTLLYRIKKYAIQA